MSSPDYDRIIAQERTVLASIQDQGDKIIPEFKKAASSYVRELSINLIKSYFKHKPQLAKNLGAQKLERFKQEFSGILESLPEQTSQRFDSGQIWLHRVNIPDGALSDMTYSYQLEQRSKKSIDDAIRELIGLIGALLIKYGFVEVGKDFTWKTSPGGITQYANDLPTRGMDHHQALSKLQESYKNLLIEYVYAVQNLRKAEQARQSSETN